METNSMHLYEKLSAISNKLGVIGKELNVAGYKAVSERSILKEIKPLEEEYKVFSYPISREVVWQEVVSRGETNWICVRIKTVYRFVNIDCPSQYIDVESFGDGIDTMDKSCGKAMTYADKYALMKCYKIVTGDDPDAEASKPIFGQNLSKTDSPVSDNDWNLYKKADEIWKSIPPVKRNKVRNWLKTNKNIDFNEPYEIEPQFIKLFIQIASN